MVTKKHRHLHLNVKRTMPRAKVTADIERAFKMDPDTIGMCELETPWHHQEFLRCARQYGYDTYLPSKGSAGALGLAVKASYGHIVQRKAHFCVPGVRRMSPHRWILTAKVRRHVDDGTVLVAETHQYASGWTGRKSRDALRQARWYIGMTAVRAVMRRETKGCDVVIGAGDLNRPPSTFRKGVLPGLLAKTGMAATGYAHTDATHGRNTFDYAWFLSKTVKPKVDSWSTPEFHSDHDAIVMDLIWQAATGPSRPKKSA